MSKQVRGAVLPFQRWLSDSGRVVDVTMVEILLDLKENYLESGPYTWPAGAIDQLLLSVVPRKVVDNEPSDDTPAKSLGAYLEFLHQTKRLGAGSASYQTLVREFEEAAEEYPDTMGDTSRGGMGKAVLNAGAAAGIDLNGPEDVQTLVDFFNGLPMHERDQILARAPGFLGLDDGTPGFVADAAGEPDEFDDLTAGLVDELLGDRDELPLVRLASVAELAATARVAHIIARLRALVDVIGQGRKVTKTNVLTRSDARAVIGELKLWDDKGSVPDFRSAREVWPLDRLWSIAVVSGLLEIRGQWVRPNPLVSELDSLDDTDVLEFWRTVAGTAVAWLLSTDCRGRLGLALHWALIASYIGREAVTFRQAAGRAFADDTGGFSFPRYDRTHRTGSSGTDTPSGRTCTRRTERT